MAEPALTILNEYSLIASAAAFTSAITALAARVEAEGHRGILSYRFYVDANGGKARAVIDYAEASAWIGHHDIAMGWPEMKQLHAVARLSEVTFLGPLTMEIQSWLEKSGLTAKIQSGYNFAAGFQRV